MNSISSKFKLNHRILQISIIFVTSLLFGFYTEIRISTMESTEISKVILIGELCGKFLKDGAKFWQILLANLQPVSLPGNIF